MSLTNDGIPFTMNVQPAGYGNNNGGCGFGGDWMAFIVLFLLFGMFGWGGFGGWGGGFGGGGAQQGYDTRADLQRGFDNQAVVTKLDGITHGICDAAYSLNNTMTTGFSNAELSRCNQQAALMQQLFSMQMQNQNCCCENEKGQLMIQNAMERGFCQTSYNDQANTNAIIQNSHNDTDRVLAKLDAMEMARKDETIDALRSQVNALNLAQSQANQNNYLVNQLRPCPTPAYITCNPWASQASYGSCGNYGSNCGCGC